MGREPARRGRPPWLYSASPRADGGIGRRARLRAWSGITGWRFESSSAHHRKPRSGGVFSFLDRPHKRGQLSRGNAYWQQGPHRVAPVVAPQEEACRERRLRFEQATMAGALARRRAAEEPPVQDRGGG